MRAELTGDPSCIDDTAADATAAASEDIDDGLPRYSDSDSIGFGPAAAAVPAVPTATRRAGGGGLPHLVAARAHDDPYVAGVASLLSLGGGAGAQSQPPTAAYYTHTHTHTRPPPPPPPDTAPVGSPPPAMMPVSHHTHAHDAPPPPRPLANAADVQKLIAELRAIDDEEPVGVVERAARARGVQRRLMAALVLADPRY